MKIKTNTMTLQQTERMKGYCLAQILNSNISLSDLQHDFYNNQGFKFYRDIIKIQLNCIEYDYINCDQLKENKLYSLMEFYKFIVEEVI